MDVFAHVLWTNIVFYKKYRVEKIQRYIAMAFGVLPDLLVFTPAFFYVIFSGKHLAVESFNSGLWVFRYAAAGYNYTHSLVIFAATIAIVTVIRRGKQYWPMWGWALHILIDIPSHKGFYETPFLFPLSGYKFDSGISWGHPLFMLINYATLFLIYLFWFFVLRKKYGQKPVG